MTDRRFLRVRSVHTPTSFDPPRNRREWERRAVELRTRILAVAGLRPMPERTEIRPHLSRVLDRGRYRIENLWFDTGRGTRVAGNLYMPEGAGPFPAVLHPHGHWVEGRAADDVDGSSQAFCLSLARAGYVVFAWDMIGYNDARCLPHDFSDRRAARLGITLLGLQLWNGLRAVDFVAAHPGVDAGRIGIAGASGGATQAMLLGAVEGRVRASVLVCMISSTMQGGCVCENAPGLRIDTNNVELSALFAPRPLLLVSATGDWTARTPRREFPAIRKVYRLYRAASSVANSHFRLPHNLLPESREAAYAWLARHLAGPFAQEEPYRAEKISDLLARPPRPVRVRTRLLKEGRARSRVDGEALRLCSGIEMPKRFVEGEHWIGRPGVGDRIPIRWIGEGRGTTLVVHDGTPQWRGPGRALIVDVFGIGSSRGPDRRARSAVLSRSFWARLARWSGRAPRVRIALDDYFTTYNRSDDAERIQDVVTAMSWLKPGFRLFARGRAAAWASVAALIAPRAGAVDVKGTVELDLPCAELFFSRRFIR